MTLTVRGRHRLNLQLTAKGWWAIERARRLRLHPELDPVNDWIEVPASWLACDREPRPAPLRVGP